MNELVEMKAQSTAMTATDKAALMSALRDSLYPGAKDASIEMVLAYCQAGGYDPMTKPVHIVPVWDKNSKAMRDTIMPGIGLYRIIADRTGKYAGQDDAEFGPTMEAWGVHFPQWCKVTVWKFTAAGRVAYSAKVFWLELYSTAGRDTDVPNTMWKKRPFGQLEKCAESAALRKAFPEIGSQITVEEMADKELMIAEAASPSASPAPTTASRTEAIKAKLRQVTHENSRDVGTLHAVLRDGENVDAATGEIVDADPIADLLAAITEAGTREELEAHRAAVAALKAEQKKRAIDAWKAAEARIATAA